MQNTNQTNKIPSMDTYIIHLISNKTWGGGEEYALNLLKAFQDKEYHVSAFTRNIDHIKKKLEEQCIPTSTLPLKGIADFSSALRLAQTIRKYAKVLIHVHNFKDAFTAVFAKQLSRHQHCKIILTRHLVKKGKNNLLYRWLYNHIDHIICVSNICKDEFLSTLTGIKTPVEVIYNGVQPISSISMDLRNRYKIHPDDIILMYHGRIAPEKGIETLIDALQDLTFRYKLVLIGTGEQEYVNKLHTLVEQCNLSDKVLFLGFQSNASSLCLQCDIGIVPSIAKESFSLSCVEYMAAGKPVITTNNGAQKEYIQDYINSILVHPGAPNEIANAIVKIISNKALRDEIGINAYNTYLRELSYSIFLNRILDIYAD